MLLLTDDEFQLEFNVPGHFTVYKPFTIGFHEDGKIINQNKYIFYKAAIAGDVNKDNVIDVQDALYMKEKWGTNDRKADINFDGKVDERDMGFVKKNYLMQNPTVKNAPTAKENVKGQTLEKIMGTLGINK